jgi:alpha-L-arabinofuranosidase
LAGDHPLKIASSASLKDGPDMSATLSPRDDAVVLMAVNDQLKTIEHLLDLSAFETKGIGRRQEIEVWTLADTQNAGEPDVTNTFAEPERIVPRRTSFTVASSRFEFRFPPLSLTVLRWVIPTGDRNGEPTR